MKKNEIRTVSSEVLDLSGVSLLNKEQLKKIYERTPTDQTYLRPGKGGEQWTYVKGSYAKKLLNICFGHNYSFTVREYKFDIAFGQVFVLGQLKIRIKDQEVIREQFGRVDIKFKTQPKFDQDGKPVMLTARNGSTYQAKEPSENPLDLGNDLKAATTDALKKCMNEFGFFSDIYSQDDFIDIEVMTREEKEQDKVDKLTARLKAVLGTINTVKDFAQLKQNFYSQNGGLISSDQEALFDEKETEIKNDLKLIN